MDRSAAPGHGHRWSAAPLNQPVCLERTIELDNVRLPVRDWPGREGPLVHVPDALTRSSFIEGVAAFTPGYRVLSVSPRDAAYQVQAFDVVGVLAQFGFAAPIVVGEGLGCAAALLVAAWYPERVGGLVLLDARYQSSGDSQLERSLRECPPDVEVLRREVQCPVLETDSVDEIKLYLRTPLP
jgi:pimeloyl-ACP methyl ester carboxylesterase